jgi:subtilase family serine protease
MNSRVSKLLMLATALLGESVFAQNSGHAVMPNTTPGKFRSHAWVVSSVASPGALVNGPGQSCGLNENTCYYLPANLNTAYAVPSIVSGNGGQGITIAIVDSFFNPQTESDLLIYTNYTGLPTCSTANGCLTIVNQTGVNCTTTPASCSQQNSFDAHGWAIETNLDVQSVHAIAPNAHILLVTAADDFQSNLYPAVQYAMTHADVVSNSWGELESDPALASESTFSPSTVPILFSSGDDGAATQYPCTSAFVTCVGGTHLLTTATSFRTAESAWGGADSQGGSGGGCSSLISVPSYQSAFTTTTCGTSRGAPDIAADADLYTGFLTYLGPNAALGLGQGCTPTLCPPNGYVIGGTSLACPLTAGILANIDADRVAHGKSKIGSNLTTLLYQAAAVSYHYRFYDVTTGTSGFSAVANWDKATGLGVITGPALAVYLLTTP